MNQQAETMGVAGQLVVVAEGFLQVLQAMPLNVEASLPYWPDFWMSHLGSLQVQIAPACPWSMISLF
jgi:hypothetical protein